MPVLLKLPPPAAFSVGFLVQDGAKQKAPFQPTHVCLLIGQPGEADTWGNSLHVRIIHNSNQTQI